MNDQPTSKYGPKARSPAVLKQAYECPTENNDEPVTRETVQGWLAYFSEHEKGIRESHKGIIARIQGTD
ncbi:MAG: hypothetical protein WAN65_20600 [Candidatus Sulfotelmatobacter sp.]